MVKYSVFVGYLVCKGMGNRPMSFAKLRIDFKNGITLLIEFYSISKYFHLK